MSEDTNNSAPSLAQAPVPPEIEATHHGISFFHTTDTSPDASASVLAGDAAASAPPATEDAIVLGITDDAHGTTPALPALPTHQDGNSLPKSRVSSVDAFWLNEYVLLQTNLLSGRTTELRSSAAAII